MSRVLAIVVAGCLLAACAVSPERRSAVDALIDERMGQLNVPPPLVTEAMPSPLADLTLEDGRHHLVPIAIGLDALAIRIHMIRAASERIVLMNYILYDDEAGRLVLAELLDAARRGVEVQVLVDGLFSLSDPDLLAGLALASDALQIRLYSPLFERARPSNAALIGAIACCFTALNHRMHHKLLAIDNRHALIGGRNTADRYFELDTRTNFLDMEVLVSGPIAGEMTADFDHYWDHPRSRPSIYTRDVAATLLDRAPGSLALARTDRAAEAVERVEDTNWLPGLIEAQGIRVDHMRYFSDGPDKPWQPQTAVSTREIHNLVASARKRVVIQTPYWVMSSDFRRALASVADDVEIAVSTNSLAASDAWPVYAISRKQRERMVNGLGVRIHEFKPFPADRKMMMPRYERLIEERAQGVESAMRGDPASALRDMPGPRLSVHGKLVVIDDKITIVTSHNFDPRSERFNTENGIVVVDPGFARAMSDYIDAIIAPRNSWQVGPRQEGPPVLDRVNRGLARISRWLPTLDLWPFYMTRKYEVPDGRHHLDPLDPDFHDQVIDQGLGPEVISYQRRFVTALVSRMLGFIRPIM